MNPIAVWVTTMTKWIPQLHAPCRYNSLNHPMGHHYLTHSAFLNTADFDIDKNL